MSDLGKLSDAWQRYGCAICGTTVQHRAESGWRIELHHITPRGRGGGDEPENLMGLCGELLPNKCHWRVTTNRVKIAWESDLGGFVWTEVESGEADLCRMLSMDTISALELDRELPTETHQVNHSLAPIPAEYLPSPLHAEQGVVAAQERFKASQELVLRAERTWMALALLVQASITLGDHTLLGYETPRDWAADVGISAPTLSRLRLVASQFQGVWVALPRQDRDALSFEGLYLAAKMMKWGIWDREQALSEAIAKPVSALWMEVKGYTHATEQCVCPTCGKKHWTEDAQKWQVLERERDEAAGLTA